MGMGFCSRVVSTTTTIATTRSPYGVFSTVTANQWLLIVRQCGLHLISKLRRDAALCFAFSGEYKGRGPHPKYGDRVDYQHIPEKYLKWTSVAEGIQTRIYQAQLLHPDFPDPLNVVIIVKTNLNTNAWTHDILFSSDLSLSYDNWSHTTACASN